MVGCLLGLVSISFFLINLWFGFLLLLFLLIFFYSFIFNFFSQSFFYFFHILESNCAPSVVLREIKTAIFELSEHKEIISRCSEAL